ncbi:DUF5412 family protein [Clostridium sp. UBA4548]|nr:DUF5412 family protein [Clostridium sp. UBA4548]
MKIKRSSNTYYNYRENKAIIQRVYDDIVIINGIKLGVPNEKIDFRKK